MNLTLIRKQFRPSGIFGELRLEDGSLFCVTLEHAYLEGDSWRPKIPIGTYTCQRGIHQLKSMTKPFETFELQNVPDHSNILIHMGNFNRDSEGCILVGQEIENIRLTQMITDSDKTFAKFIELQNGVDQFELTVRLANPI